MSAPASLSQVSASAVVHSNIQGLEEVYFSLNVYPTLPDPLQSSVSLVFSSEKTALAMNEFLKSSLAPEVGLPDGESKKERCWAMDLQKWQFAQSYGGVSGVIQNLLNAIEKKVPVNDERKEFPVIVLLPSLY